jgi:hypothetical protein
MEPLTERYTRYLEAKEGDIDLCEYFTFDEYTQYLYLKELSGYKDLEKKKVKFAKYGATAAVATTVGALTVPLAIPLITMMAMVALKIYRASKDKCQKRCFRLKGAENTLCKTHCNRDAALAAIDAIEKKRTDLLAKAKDDKAKVAIHKKIDKKLKFFKDKLAQYDTTIKDYKRSLVRATD